MSFAYACKNNYTILIIFILSIYKSLPLDFGNAIKKEWLTHKKIIGIFVAAMLFLSGCAGGGGSATVTRGGNDDFTATGQKVESSIFGRNIKYDAFTPAKCERQEITLLLHHAVASSDFRAGVHKEVFNQKIQFTAPVKRNLGRK